MSSISTIPGSVLRLFRRYATPAARGALFLMAVDVITNGIDYGFHIFLGRALAPADFAVTQTLNSLILIVLTTFGVLQPVVARAVAESETGAEQGSPAASRIIFQHYFRLAAAIGVFLLALAWLVRKPLAAWLVVPPAVFTLALLVVPPALLRPVVAGFLQGRERMIGFGLIRTAHAAGRFVTAILLVGVAGLLGAVAAFPIAAVFALVIGLIFIDRSVWQPGPPLPRRRLYDGVQLAASALLAYAAYMSLINYDLIWVNHTFSPEIAGDYATAVLLRRVLALAPGAMLVVFYPRVIVCMAQGRLPDGLLLKSAAVITLPTLALIALYFGFGSDIVRFTFGGNYGPPNWLLGWLGVGMLGYTIASIWLNLYLAARPFPFVIMLAAIAIAQVLLFIRFGATLSQTVAIFALGGWALTLGGLAIYLLVLRPSFLTPKETNY